MSGAPAVNIKFSRKTLNRTESDAVKLTCIVQGQPGMNIFWTREGKIIDTSTFENNSTVYPSHLGISGTSVSNLTVTYHTDKEIFEHFNCSKSEENFRELHCRSIYQCSASYPGGKATTKSVIINVSPNISE